MDNDSSDLPKLNDEVPNGSLKKDVALQDQLQLQTTRLLRLLSRLSFGLGITLFIALSIACGVIYYGDFQVQALVGFHICFFFLGLGACIYWVLGGAVPKMPNNSDSKEPTKESSLEDQLLEGQLRTTQLMKLISKMSVGLGIILFIALTVACSIVYRGAEMQGIIGYHISFFLIGMGVCIHFASKGGLQHHITVSTLKDTSRVGNLSDRILKAQRRTGHWMQMASKLFLVLGFTLFVALTVVCSISYRDIAMQAIIGYHICFFLFGTGAVINFAYKGECSWLPFGFASKENAEEKISCKSVWITFLGLSQITIGICQILGEILYLKKLRKITVYINGLWFSSGIFLTLNGLLCCALVFQRKRERVWGIVFFGILSLVCSCFINDARVQFHSSYDVKTNFQKIKIFNQSELSVYPNLYLVATSLLMKATPPLGISISSAIIMVGFFLIFERSGASLNKNTNHVLLNIYCILGSIIITTGLCFNFTYFFLKELDDGYYFNSSVAVAIVVPSLLAGFVALGCRSEHGHFGMRLLLLIISCILLVASVFVLTDLTGSVSRQADNEESYLDEKRGIPSDDMFCNVPMIENDTQTIEVTPPYQSYGWNQTPKILKSVKRVCIPASKICDGFLDYLYHNITEVYDVNFVEKNTGPFIDEVACLTTRFYYIFIIQYCSLALGIIVSSLLAYMALVSIVKDVTNMLGRTFTKFASSLDLNQTEDFEVHHYVVDNMDRKLI